MITRKELLKLFDYHPESGILSRKDNGAVCYSATGDGYLRVEMKGQIFRIHRLAHLWMTGKHPKHQIDHIDKHRHNNTWWNTRPATMSQNNFNRRLQRNNKSGHKGVCQRGNKWQASIQIRGKKIHLGAFDELRDAVRVRVRQGAAKKFHGPFLVDIPIPS
jgi:hypothetical protein